MIKSQVLTSHVAIICRDQNSHQDLEAPLATFLHEVRRGKRKNQYAKDLPFPDEWQKTLMERTVPYSVRWMGDKDISTCLNTFLILES